MLTFLRKIRKSLIESLPASEGAAKQAGGSAQKYMLYAIGEIALVVIGILIALQINNWNEQNKNIKKENQILSEIKRNVTFNTERFREEIKMEEKVINSIDIVLQNINQTKVYNDTLDKHFALCMWWPASSWETSGFETLKSEGIELIESESLRESIINLYQISYAEILEIIRVSEGVTYSTYMPVYTRFFELVPADSEQSIISLMAKPFDYSKVIQSEEIRGVLGLWRGIRSAGQQLRLLAIGKNQELIEAITDQLEERKK